MDDNPYRSPREAGGGTGDSDPLPSRIARWVLYVPIILAIVWAILVILARLVEYLDN